MSAVAPETPAPPPGTLRCARCGAEVPPDHDWCLECGYAARTFVAPTPRWRIPLFIAAGVAALALAALAVAFVDLTEDPDGPATTPTTAVTTAPPPTTVPPPTATVPPTATAPPPGTPPAPGTPPTTPGTPPAPPGTPPTTPTTPTATAPAAPSPAPGATAPDTTSE